MPTVTTETVKPSGGDYTLLSTALAAVNTNLVTADIQWNIECSAFVGGLNESVAVPAITQDATRYLHVKTAPGDEYDFSTDTGFVLIANVGFGSVFTDLRAFGRVSGIGIHNTRTLASAGGMSIQGTSKIIDNVFSMTDGSSGTCINLNNANLVTISNCLTYKGTVGVEMGNNSSRACNKITAIDAITTGFNRGTASAVLIDCLSIGAPTDYDTGFTGNNNASEDLTAPGTSSLTGRSTADLADYAGDDFRTASGSALATAGSVDFIGFALEAASGSTLAADSGTYTYTGAAASLLASRIIQADSGSYTYTGTNVSLLKGSILDASSGSYSYTGTNANLIYTPVGSNILIADSGTYSYVGADINFNRDRVILASSGVYTYTGTSVQLNLPVSVPINPRNVITVSRKSNSILVKRTSNKITVR